MINLMVTASVDILWPKDSKRCSGSFAIFINSVHVHAHIAIFGHSAIICLTEIRVPHDRHIGESILLIRRR